MGDYRIVIDGVGNHGCGRGEETLGAGGELVMTPCGHPTCVDCIAREAVEKLKGAGTVTRARLEHWPEQPLRHDTPGPVDDLVAGTRSKPF